jgi:hypothetical protein
MVGSKQFITSIISKAVIAFAWKSIRGGSMSKKTHKALLIRFSEELREKIARRAAEQERPLNYIVLKIVEEYFAKEGSNDAA